MMTFEEFCESFDYYEDLSEIIKDHALVGVSGLATPSGYYITDEPCGQWGLLLDRDWYYDFKVTPLKRQLFHFILETDPEAVGGQECSRS